MNGPGDIILTQTNNTLDKRYYSFVSIIPTLGMSSCRGRAEAFARRLSSKLRTLGSQTDHEAIAQEDEHILSGNSTKNWISHDGNHSVTDLQNMSHESDSLFDFDCELESPGSPENECEYLRLIETGSNTPQNPATKTGIICASAANSHSSTDVPYFDDPNLSASCSLVKHPTADVSSNTSPNSYNSDPQNVSEICCNSNGVNIHHIGVNNESCKDGEKNEEGHGSSEGGDQTEPARLSECEISTETMIAVQSKIINELKKTSEHIFEKSAANKGPLNDKSATTHHLEPLKTSDLQDDGLENRNINCFNKLNVKTNGYSKYGDEVLKVIVSETKKEILGRGYVGGATNINEETIKTSSTEGTPECGIVIDTTDDEDECRPHRVRRCSSLKTGKTPPGTPGRKKIVRFADVLGLDLADIKTFLDEIPTIPRSAFEDLQVIDAEPPVQLGPKSYKILTPLFQQPGGLSTFLDLVREKLVSLENAAVTDHINQTITGSVRVRNLDFHKSVHIRYTLDNWRSFADLQANYVENSCDGFSDKFTFILFGNTLQIGQRLEFAVRFQCKGQQFWDSNYGTNYCFQCLPTSSLTPCKIPPTVPSHHANDMSGMLSPAAADAWCSSFY